MPRVVTRKVSIQRMGSDRPSWHLHPDGIYGAGIARQGMTPRKRRIGPVPGSNRGQTGELPVAIVITIAPGTRKR
jgi:hypothetical protein